MDQQDPQADRVQVAKGPADAQASPVSPDGLYAHQREALKKLERLPNGAILFECGLGKTRTALELCARKGYRRVLVLMPLSVVTSWQEELLKAGFIGVTVSVVEGTPDKKRAAILQGAKLTLMSYDSVPSLLSTLTAAKFDALICDESTKLKHSQTQRTRAVTALSDTIPARWILTGTPVTQHATDLWSQFRIVAPSILGSSYWVFRNTYCILQDRYVPRRAKPIKEIVGYKNLDQLMQRIAPVSVLATKKDCLDLPKKIYQKRSFPLSPEQKAVIKALKAAATQDLGGVMTCLVKMQQVCAGWNVVTDRPFDTHPKKTALLDLLDEVTPPVLIWCRFLADVALVAGLLEAAGWETACMTGEDSAAGRADVLRRWHEGTLQALVATNVGGFGLNLQGRCTTAVYYSLEWSYEKRLQSEDRLHRIGTLAPVTYIDLLCQRSVDRQIYRTVKAKGDFAKYVMQNLATVLEEDA